MRRERLDRRSVLARALRIIYGVVLAALAACAILVGGTIFVLETRAGAALAKRIALGQVNRRIAGRLAVARLTFSPERLTLDGIALFDPEGRAAATVERLEIAFSPRALLRRRLDVGAIVIRQPRVALVEDERGLGIARAFGPAGVEHPPAREGEPGSPSRFSVRVRGWELTGGELDWRRADGSRVLRLEELASFGALEFADRRLRAATTVEGPDLRIDLRGHLDFAAGKSSSFEATASAVLAGATMTARGTGAGGALDAAAEMTAGDLAALARQAGAILDRPLPAITGRGRLALALSGPAAGPRLRIELRAPALRVGAESARELVASAVVPDLRAPEALDLDVRAAGGAIGGRGFRAAAVTARASGRHVTARARVTGPEPLALDVGGRRDPQGRSLRLETLRLATRQASWTLVHPARIELGPDRFVVSGLALAAGRQRVEVDVARTPGEGRRRGAVETRGEVAVTALDLALLPPALLPPGGRPGGRLDASVRFRAAVGGPRFEITAALTGGRFGPLRDVALRLDARGADGRARGQLEAHAAGASLGGGFDVPLRWPLARGRGPIAATLSLAIPDLGAARAAVAAATAAPLPKLAGAVRVSARLDGARESPALAVDARAAGLAVGGRPVGDLVFGLRAAGDGRSEAHLEATGPPAARSARLRLSATSPLALRDVLRRPPGADALARTPIALEGEAARVPLALLATLVPRLPRLGGTLSAAIALSGPVRAPAGSVSVSLDGVTADGLRATDVRLGATVRAGAVEGHARVLRAGHPLAVAEVRLDAGAEALWRPSAFAGAAVHARATVGPLRIQRRDVIIIHEPDRARAEAAIVRGALTVEGSLRAPRATLDADARAVGADGSLAATARLAARYADRRTTLDGRVASAHDGALKETVELDADLGAEGLARGLDLRRLPFRIEIEARRFELDGLCGFLPGLRTAAGHLDGTLRGWGTLNAPHFAGRLRGEASELAIGGLGDYHDVALALAGDENRLKVEKLVAHAGAGEARLSGDVSRAGGSFRLSARADISRFPVYVEGQSIALLTLAATATGSDARAGAGIEVTVAQARVELSDEKRRDLQPLRTPPDVVVMRGGRPRGRDEAAKLQALPASVTGAGGAAPAGAPAEDRAAPIRVTLRAERRIWVTGGGARLELGLSPGFRLELGRRTEIFGQVTVRRGRVDVYGRRFDLRSESTVKWTGPAERPEVDISAQHDNRDEGVTVLVTIKGQLPHTSIAVSSPNRPELTESQLYTLIISGQLGGARNAANAPTSASTEALSLAGGLVAAGLQNALSKSLHLDVFSIDTSGGSSLVGTQVEAGRYVTDRLYVGYIGRIGADPTRYQNRNAVHAEYRLSSRWEIEAEYGDVGTGSADVMWKKHY